MVHVSAGSIKRAGLGGSTARARMEQKQWGGRGAAARHASVAAHQAGSAGFEFAGRGMNRMVRMQLQ